MKIPVRVRRGDAATWTSKNPILGLGELGLETDTHKLKGGDGVTDWDSLPYISAGGGGNSWGDITRSLSSQTDLQTALNAKAASSHNHTISNVTGLQTALDGKADSSHNHIISDVTGLQSALDNKQSTLISGTDIKTINGASLLGSGDITVSGGVEISSATITIPNGRGVYEYSAVITDATVNSGHLITCQLAPHSDSDENASDMLSLRSATAIAGNGNFTVNLSFDERTSGIIKLRYFKS